MLATEVAKRKGLLPEKQIDQESISNDIIDLESYVVDFEDVDESNYKEMIFLDDNGDVMDLEDIDMEKILEMRKQKTSSTRYTRLSEYTKIDDIKYKTAVEGGGFDGIDNNVLKIFRGCGSFMGLVRFLTPETFKRNAGRHFLFGVGGVAYNVYKLLTNLDANKVKRMCKSVDSLSKVFIKETNTMMGEKVSEPFSTKKYDWFVIHADELHSEDQKDDAALRKIKVNIEKIKAKRPETSDSLNDMYKSFEAIAAQLKKIRKHLQNNIK